MPSQCHQHPLLRRDNRNTSETNPQETQRERWEVQGTALQAEHRWDTSLVMVAGVACFPSNQIFASAPRRAATTPISHTGVLQGTLITLAFHRGDLTLNPLPGRGKPFPRSEHPFG